MSPSCNIQAEIIYTDSQWKKLIQIAVVNNERVIIEKIEIETIASLSEAD